MIEDNQMQDPSMDAQEPGVPFQDPRVTVGAAAAPPTGIGPSAFVGPPKAPAVPSMRSGVSPSVALLEARRNADQKLFDQQLANSMMMVSKVDPELAAEAQRMGFDLNLPDSVVEYDMDAARELWNRRQVDTYKSSSGSAMSMRAMLDPAFAKIAMDDLKNLTFGEMIWAQRSAGKLEEEQALLWEKVRIGAASDEDRARITDLTTKLNELPSSTDIGGFFEGLVYAGVKMEAGMESSMLWSLGAGAAGGATALALGSAGPQAFIPEELVSVPAMSGAAFFGTLGVMSARREAGGAYGSMISMGVDHETAKRWAGGVGFVNGILEAVSGGILTQPFRKEIVKRLTKEMATDMLVTPTITKAAWKAARKYTLSNLGELSTEIGQEISTYLGEAGAINEQGKIDPSKLSIEGREGLWDRLASITSETLRGMALIQLPGPLFEMRANAMRAKRAEFDGKWMENLGKNVDESKVNKRNPDMHLRFLEQLAKSAEDASTVYVPTADFLKLLKSSGMSMEQLQKLAPQVAARLKDAGETGDVEIPTAGFGAKFLTTTFGKALVPYARLDPGGTSVMEEEANSPEMRAEQAKQAEEILAKAGEAFDIVREESTAVEKTIKDQLVAAGQMPSDAAVQARYYRNAIVVHANALGLTPQQLHDARGWEVKSEAEFAKQQQQVGDELDQLAPEDKAKLQGTKAADESGKPIRVLHVTTRKFDTFRTDGNQTSSGERLDAAFFTDSTDYTDEYAIVKGAGARTIPAYLSLKNPLQVEAGPREFANPDFEQVKIQEARASGHDGVVFRDTDSGDRFFAVFDPDQIVNAIGVKPNELEQKGEDKASRGVEQHRLAGNRAVRVVGETSRLSAAEKSAIEKAVAKNPNVVGLTRKALEERVREHKLAFPVTDGWAPLEVVGVTVDKKKKDAQGRLTKWEPKYQIVPYTFNRGSDGKTLNKKAAAKRVTAMGSRMYEEVVKLTARAAGGDVEASKILRQAGWYREMRTRLRHEFGGLGDLFADLLGAMSPNTPVRENWAYAVDVLRRATKGDFDEMIPQWESWAQKVQDLELAAEAWFNEQVAAGRTKKSIASSPDGKAKLAELKAARELPDDLIPIKEPVGKQKVGAKYGFNGRNGVRALLDLWRVVKKENPDIKRGATAPKALNFSGNLIGFRQRATIDVWAARLLQRIAGDERVPVLAESGVGGSMLPSGETTGDFRFGQDVFSEAVRLIKADPDLASNKLLAQINDDDLQAIVWFLEKEVWTQHSWTSAAGEGGSFELEADLTGQTSVDAVKELRRIIDSSKSTAAEKKTATAELKKLERTVDRFIGMVSQQQSAFTQGVDFVPTDADQARLQERLHTAILEDPDKRVVASKVTSTQGLYGDPERAIDLEVITREGYDPAPLWQQLLTEALRADQDAVAMSRVLRHDEQIDYRVHRPGVEVYFRAGGTMEQVQPMLDALKAAGVQGYTVITDARRNPSSTGGAMPSVVGVRFQFSPEMEERWGGGWAGLTEEEIAAKVQQRGDEMHAQADAISKSVPGVSLAKAFWYDTKWAFRHQYEEQIHGLANRRTEASDRDAGSQDGWRGEPVSAGVASAAVRRGEAERAAAERAAGAERPAGERAAAADDVGVRQAAQLNSPARLGRYLPDIRTALLSPDANPTTVMHEMGHHFFIMLLDLTNEGLATPQMRADVDTLLSWFKLDGATPEERLATWNGMSFKAQAPFHEQVTYNFEDYLFTGKAPTAALAKVFAKIRAWMVAAYTSIRTELNAIYRREFGRDLPGLTPEVRMVFDRLVASTEAVNVAEASRSMAPLFTTVADFLAAGYTQDQWDEYQEVLAEAHELAITDLTKASLKQMKWLTGARSRVAKQMQKEAAAQRAKVEKVVRAEVEGEMVYVVQDILRTSNAAGKLSQDAVVALLAHLPAEEQKAAMAKLGTGRRGVMSKTGMPLDLAAEQAGLTGQELVEQMIAAKPIEEEVQLRTSARAVTQFGELGSKEQIDAAVEEALHNEARARFVAVELGFLEKSELPYRVMLSAARDSAQRILLQRKLHEISPSKFAQAEARAARETAAAMKPKPATTNAKTGVKTEGRKTGDAKAALEAKRRQMLNNQLASEAVLVREEVRKAVGRFSQLNRSDERLAKMGDAGLLQAARMLLAQYGLISLRASERTADYMALVQQHDPELFALLRPQLEKAVGEGAKLGMRAGGLRDFQDMTLTEFRALADAVDALVWRAKRQHEVDANGVRVRVEAAVNTLVAELNKKADLTKALPGETQAKSAWQKFKGRLLGSKANLIRVEHFMRAMDGDKQGNFLKLLFNGVRQAVDASRADAAVYTRELVELVAQLRKDGLLKDGEINAPEFGYKFGSGTKGNGMAEIVGMLLHLGNPGNKSKFFVAGRGPLNPWASIDADGEIDYTKWNDFRDRMIKDGKLVQAHFDFAQKVWNLMERMKPLLQDAHREIHGRLFREVAAESFSVTFADGTTKEYAGGYVPATRDSELLPPNELNQSVEQLSQDFHEGLPKAPEGFLKERAAAYRKRPLAMDINQIGAHIDQAIRFAHVQPAVNDVLKILGNEKFAGAMNRYDPEVIRSLMIPFLHRALRQSLYTKGMDPAIDHFWKLVRRNTGVAIMFANPVNALQQLTGISASLRYVPARHLRNGLATYMSQRSAAVDEIVRASKFMTDRMDNQMLGLTQDLRELLLDTSKTAKLQEWVGRKAYFFQSAAQNQVDIVTWLGARQQALEQGMDADAAVVEADSIVRLAQGSFNPEDVAGYDVGTPFYRSWTQFTSYFNGVLNSIMHAEGQRLRTTIVMFTIPMIISQAIAMTLWGQWDDEDDDGHWDTTYDLLLGSQLSGAAAFVPVWGPTTLGMVQTIFSDRPMGDKVAASPAMVTLARSVNGLLSAIAAAARDDREMSGKKVRDALTAIVLMVPGGGVITPAIRPASYLTDVATGKVKPTGPIDLLRGMITGKASEASK